MNVNMTNTSTVVNMFLDSRYTAVMAVTTETDAATSALPGEPCCSPLTVDVIGADDASVLAARFKAIADPVRLQILSRLAASPDGVCVCDFVDDLDRSQPTISHHLKVLGDAGLVTREQRGKWAWFHIVAAELDTLADFLTPR